VRNGAPSGTQASEGGGIVVDYSLAINLTLTNVTLDGNTAQGAGGGLKTGGGTTTLNNVTVTNNVLTAAYSIGGGIQANPNSSGDPQQLIITGGTIAGNSVISGAGAGIETQGVTTITGATISGNATTGPGGAGEGNGGGIAGLYGGVLHITNSTIANNTVTGGQGGGFYTSGVGNTLTNDTIIGNTATDTGNGGGVSNEEGGIVSKNVLIANNTGGNCNKAGSLEIGPPGSTNNASSDTTCGLSKTGDITNATVGQLYPFDIHGGTNKTAPPLPANPVVGTANGPACPASDQRGAVRPAGTGCDIGAAELQADLQVTGLTDAPDPVVAGHQITYTASVTNAGPDVSTNVTLTDTLPAGTAFVSATPSTGTCTHTTTAITCNLGATMTNGANATVTIVLTATAPGDPQNTVSISSATPSTPDPNTANSSASTTTHVDPNPNPELSVVKTAPASANPGQALAYTIAVHNSGGATATNVQVSDTLPSNVTFTSASSGCTAAGVTVTCSFGDLAASADANATINVTVAATASGTVSNTATVSPADDTPGDNTSTANTSITQPPSFKPDAKIAVGTAGTAVGDNVYSATAAGESKTVRVKRGKSVTFRIEIQNDGDADSFTVKGPGGGIYKAGTTNVTTRVKAGTYSTGSVPSGQTVILMLTVKVAKTARIGSTKVFLVVVTSTGAPAKKDAVKATVKAKK
jgi:uncharacterized repeat protein (TIGR01451 family)